MWKKALIFAFLAAGCAGRNANPVPLYCQGDESRTCRSLEMEIEQNEIFIEKKLSHDKSKFWTNTAWFILFTPAMDFKEAEKVEAEALVLRNNALKRIMVEKGCRCPAQL